MIFELTKKQKEGIDIIVQKYNDDESPYVVISGYAGTGKSTLITHAISALGLNPEDVAYAAFTGKAAEVLRKKNCPNACTLHHLLYNSTKDKEGKFIFAKKTTLEGNFKLFVVDEVSMVPNYIWDLLLSHKIFVIACGDPFQLPPVEKDKAVDILNTPDIFLDEIMRQAAESEIIQLSLAIREGKPIQYFKGKEVQVLRQSEVVEGMYSWADQILVATNKKRDEVNSICRSIQGLSGPPQKGDKVISLENHWGILDEEMEAALVNGTIGTIENICESTRTYRIGPRFVIGPIPIYKIDFKSEAENEYIDLGVDKKYILQREKTLTPKQEWHIYKNSYKLPEVPCQMDFGYGITVHRAQGSEWDKVLIFEERFPFDKEEHARWLYTAVTRGAEKVVLVR